MTAGDHKLAGVTFALLLVSVAVNLLVLQGSGRIAGVETGGIAPRPYAVGGATLLNGEDRGTGLGGAAPRTEDTANVAEIVRGIQRELNTRGYEAGPPDGVAGLVTRAAIMAYEHDYGLPLTATPAQELLSRIVLGTASPQAGQRTGASDVSSEAEGVVQIAEQALSTLGYQAGKADGKLNEQTARAIREFELDQKLPETGRISGPLLSRLLRLQSGQVTAPVAKAGTPEKSVKPEKVQKAEKAEPAAKAVKVNPATKADKPARTAGK